MITGNKGEWSEIYAFLRLLSTGKLFAADEQLNRIENMFFPIMKIIREEVKGYKYEYHTGETIRIYLGKTLALEMPVRVFKEEADYIYNAVEQSKAGKGAFSVEKTEAFMRKIFVGKIAAPSKDKTDINVQLRDVNTGYEQIVGFSIKSELGSPPTLLNAGDTTNFVYKVEGMDARFIDEINAIDTKTKIIDRIETIRKRGGEISFFKMKNDTFNNNLIMIDSQMPGIVADMLIGYYLHNVNDCIGLLNYVNDTSSMNLPKRFYAHKIKEFLCAVALGMKPATKWEGTYEATGGYIVVKTDGEVLAYHIHNRDSFMNYLLKNTRFDRGGTQKHNFAKLYQVGDEIFINFNLQIRFI